MAWVRAQAPQKGAKHGSWGCAMMPYAYHTVAQSWMLQCNVCHSANAAAVRDGLPSCGPAHRPGPAAPPALLHCCWQTPVAVGAQPAATPPAASGPSACRSWRQADPWAHMQQQPWPHKRRKPALGRQQQRWWRGHCVAQRRLSCLIPAFSYCPLATKFFPWGSGRSGLMATVLTR